MTAPTPNKPGTRRLCSRVAWSLALLLSAACSSSGEATYPGLGSSGSSGLSGGTSGTGGSSGGTTTGIGGTVSVGVGGSAGADPAVDGGAGGAVSEDGAAPDAGPLASPLCDPAMTWTALRRIESIAPTPFAQLGGLSRDELTVGFTSTTGDAYVADRPTVTTSFDAPQKVNDASTPLAIDRIGLAPNGMTILAVTADKLSFIGFERAARGEPWTVTNGLEFTQLRALSESGTELSNPMLGDDKRSLFLIATAHGRAVLYESVWDSAQRSWGRAVSVNNPELLSPDPTHRRRPTGASSDGRTLFFYDEVLDKQGAAWRDSSGSTFSLFRYIGAFPEATPTAGCDRLYYQAFDQTGPRLYLVDPE